MEIKVGSRVKVKDKTLAAYGRRGVVTSIDDGWINVRLDKNLLSSVILPYAYYEREYLEEELEIVSE